MNKSRPKIRSTRERRIWSDGYDQGRISGLQAGREAVLTELSNSTAHQRESAHIKALETIAKIGNALGQTIESISHAMRSDRGQL